MNIPSEYKYTKEHEWILVEGSTATIGITDFAASELGDIVFIDIDANLTSITGGEKFGTIEAVKTVSDLFAPCSGKVIEINSSLNASPETVNNEPYTNGWMIKIEIANTDELSGLLSADDYSKIIGH